MLALSQNLGDVVAKVVEERRSRKQVGEAQGNQVVYHHRKATGTVERGLRDRGKEEARARLAVNLRQSELRPQQAPEMSFATLCGR